MSLSETTPSRGITVNWDMNFIELRLQIEESRTNEGGERQRNWRILRSYMHPYFFTIVDAVTIRATSSSHSRNPQRYDIPTSPNRTAPLFVHDFDTESELPRFPVALCGFLCKRPTYLNIGNGSSERMCVHLLSFSLFKFKFHWHLSSS